MNFDPKAVRRALMVAKDLATSIDPGFANIQPPMPPQGVPLERAKGGEVKNVLPVGSPERSENLKQWLGDSFLHVDGNPKTYYHGTSKDKPFTGFKVGRHGAWFTSDPGDASMYAHQNDSMTSRFEAGRFVPQNTASRVMPVFLKADNPFFGEFPEKYKNVENYKKAQSDWFDELRANGHDSWIPRSQEGNLAVMLGGPHQVKSAVGNVGTFDPTSADITKAEGGEVEAAGMGINVRSDKKAGMRYADEIVDGNKLYETRDTDSLRPYVGKRVAIVRTGEGPAKAIGEVTVGEPVVADQAMFHKMRPHHLVPAGSAFDIKQGGQKYLYPMHDPVRFDDEKDVGAGIIARKVISKAEGGSVDDHPDQGYAPKPPGVLDVDNPGGDWLKENREYSESRGYMPSGAPKSFGKTTAVWREPKSNEIAPVYLPVSMLAQLPGVMSEQKNVRSHDLDWLTDHMGKTGKLPKINDREYKPFITVDHRGMPFVSEGNHRIMAAAKLGWDYLPVEVRYFNGAEDVDGPLHPDRIREMHGINMPRTGGVENRVVDSAKAARRALMIAKDELGHGRT